MPYTTPVTFVAGDVLTAAQMNTQVRDNVSFLANPPACRVFHSVAQATTSGSAAVCAFDSERLDTDNMHSTSVNNGRITFNTAGLYYVQALIRWQQNGTGYRDIGIWKLGTTAIAYDIIQPLSVNVTIHQVSTIYKFIVGDWVQLNVFQNSGGALNIDSTAESSPEFSAVWVGRG